MLLGSFCFGIVCGVSMVGVCCEEFVVNERKCKQIVSTIVIVLIVVPLSLVVAALVFALSFMVGLLGSYWVYSMFMFRIVGRSTCFSCCRVRRRAKKEKVVEKVETENMDIENYARRDM